MKKTLILIAIFSVFVLLFSQCRKDDSVFDVYFWTSINNTAESLTLYIDNENKGILPYMDIAPKCGNDTLLADLIYIQLSAGRYKIKVKDENGVVKIEGKMTYKRNKQAVSVGTGGIGSESQGNCDVVVFF